MITRGLLWLLFSFLMLLVFNLWHAWLVVADDLCALVQRTFAWLYQDIGL